MHIMMEGRNLYWLIISTEAFLRSARWIDVNGRFMINVNGTNEFIIHIKLAALYIIHIFILFLYIHTYLYCSKRIQKEYK